jgi:hypothetical protein
MDDTMKPARMSTKLIDFPASPRCEQFAVRYGLVTHARIPPLVDSLADLRNG